MSFIKTLKNEKGNAYVEFLVSLWLLVVVFALGISILSIFSTRYNLENCADTLIKVAETEGTTDLDVTIEKLKETTGLDFEVSWTGTEYILGTEKVQLGDVIFLTVTDSHEIGVGKYAQPVQMISRREGMSEKYHK